MVWIALVVGAIWPDAGVFLLSFVTLPDWVQDRWVRMAMVAAALLLPAGIGVLSTRVTDSQDQPKGFKATLQRILHGYPYTVATSLALIMMIAKEANELEDRLGAIWDRVKAKDAVQGQVDLAQQLEQLERDLRSAKISSEEWEILLREKLLVERAILQVAAGLVNQAREPAEMDAKKLGTGAVLSSAPTPGEMLLRRALVVIGAVLGLWIVSRKSS